MSTSSFFIDSPKPLKRPPSYSDSYYILGGPHSHTELVSIQEIPIPIPKEENSKAKSKVEEGSLPIAPRVYLFGIKSAIHIFLISVFETIFFFKYVSITENNGILKTINTYYQPLLTNCSGWTQEQKGFIEYILTQDLNYTEVEQKGNDSEMQRGIFNRMLLWESLAASGICLVLVCLGAGVLKWKKVPVRWPVVFGENLSMVLLLGLYEFIFFQYIIYNYSTLSTPELNAYLLRGFYECSL
jgi:hypothetical protein